MQNMILVRIIFAVMGTVSIIVLFPFVVLGVIIMFCYNIIRTKQCTKCSKWFTGTGSICSACTPTPAILSEAAGNEDGWITLRDETVSHGLDMALAVNEHGDWYIGEGAEDPMNIEWKILGRDM